MSQALQLHPDRLLPRDEPTRKIARELYEAVRDLPIISPHGHTDPAWFALNQSFGDPTELLLKPDHYVLRMLYSQGVSLESLGISRRDDGPVETDKRKIWRQFASRYYLFAGTPSSLWLDYVFAEIFGLELRLDGDSADHYYDHIMSSLASDDFKPRRLFDRFNIEALATTESPLDDLQHHRTISDSDWTGRVISTYRPDPVVDPEHEGFFENIVELGRITGEDTINYQGYLNAHRKQRQMFASLGTTATDHGHPSASTADLDRESCEKLYSRIIRGKQNPGDNELFRAQMLTEMAAMSLEDGLVMQLHPGSQRNHNLPLWQQFGRDKGADIPKATEYVEALQPLLNRFGNDPRLSLILFTLDESTYARELAPLAGHYPCLKLGPAWWFHDSPEGMRRYRQSITETAGFYNTVGFNDDTRAFLSIPARHDVARRMDCGWLAELVADHRLARSDAETLARDLTYSLPRSAYKLDR